MNPTLVDMIVDNVLKKISDQKIIKVEASGRHVHLSRSSIDMLFGTGYQLTKDRDLSQPGQFVCKERIMLIGPKGSIRNVVILGPERKETQVEISITDQIILGIKAPIRESGDLIGTPSIILASNKSSIQINNGVIVAKRHIHMTPTDALNFGVTDKEIVQMHVFGSRPLNFDDVVVRVSPNYRTCMHIDYDEANACGYQKGTFAMLLKKSAWE